MTWFKKVKQRGEAAVKDIKARFADLEKANEVMRRQEGLFERAAEKLKADGRGTGKYGCTPGTMRSLLEMQKHYGVMDGVMTAFSKNRDFYDAHDSAVSKAQSVLSDVTRRMLRCEFRSVEDSEGTVGWQLQGNRRGKKSSKKRGHKKGRR